MDSNSLLRRFAWIGMTPVAAAACGFAFPDRAGDVNRSWGILLAGGYGLLGIGLGCAVWLALFAVTGARWSDAVRPAAERLTKLLPAGALVLILTLLAAPDLYPWTHDHGRDGSPFRNLWLSQPFFFLRAIAYLALWHGLTFALVRASRRRSAELPRLSAVFLVAFAITFWLASVDWIMSLEPNWASTIFGIYQFAGMFLAALAAMIVVAIGLAGGDVPFRAQQRRDLGTLLFSFSCFWGYIWFCQYLLIWYVKNPEEAEYYVVRQQEPWHLLFFANVALNWGLPSAVLLLRRARESRVALLAVALAVLLGRCVDLYMSVLPAVSPEGPIPGDSVWFAAAAGAAALIVAVPFAGRAPAAAS